MARLLWDSRTRLDVVDGYCRGLVQGEGPDRLLEILRALDPALEDPFDQRLARIGLIVASSLRPAEAAALLSELIPGDEERQAIFEPVVPRIATTWQEKGFEAPADWLATLPSSRSRNNALAALLRDWRASAPAEMGTWFEASPLAPQLKGDLRRALSPRKPPAPEAS